MIRKLVCLLALGLGLSAHAAAMVPPDQLVKSVTDELRAEIAEHQAEYKAEPDKLSALIDEKVVPHFDVPRISRLVLGLHGRGASAEQIERFGNAFKNMLFRSYATALVDYHDSVKIEWKPLRLADDATRATVQSTLIRKDAPAVPVGFVMHKTDSGWKVFDITVENISLVNNFRAQLNGEISKNGLDAVIQKLEGGEIEPETDQVEDAAG
jgi:phospholipid transport system substrate-binding protein